MSLVALTARSTGRVIGGRVLAEGRSAALPPTASQATTMQSSIGPRVRGRPAGAELRAEFDAFYRDSYPRLVAAVHAVVGDQAHAQRVVERVCTRAWSRWRTVRASPQQWARHEALRAATRRAPHSSGPRLAAWPHVPPDGVPAVGVPEGVMAATGGTGDGADAERPIGPLLGALSRVPLVQRRALVLHHVLGLDVAEVADDEHASIDVVRGRLAHGHRALAGCLDRTRHCDRAHSGVHPAVVDGP